jgi:uncharacterized paraquat-inducible protein A
MGTAFHQKEIKEGEQFPAAPGADAGPAPVFKANGPQLCPQCREYAAQGADRCGSCGVGIYRSSKHSLEQFNALITPDRQLKNPRKVICPKCEVISSVPRNGGSKACRNCGYTRTEVLPNGC